MRRIVVSTPDEIEGAQPHSAAKPSRSRVLGLAVLALVLLLSPAFLTVPAVARALQNIGVTDRPDRFIEISVFDTTRSQGFVYGNHATLIRYQIGNDTNSATTVRVAVSLVPDDGSASSMLDHRLVVVPKGGTRVLSFSGRVACTTRSRVVFAARAAGVRPVEAAFHVRHASVGGPPECTSLFGNPTA